ncbi:MAG: SOUL family heme-binding protein [Crocinitomicaceae bacterium]
MSILLLTLLVLFIGSQIWVKMLGANIETYQYELIEELDGIEIRKYAPATFSFVQLNVDSYNQGSSLGFRKLAGYIFGGNEEQKKIAMTSPVEMEMDSFMVIKFMVPSKYKMEDLPRPNNEEIKFVQEPERYVAAIRFSGFANDSKIELYHNQLQIVLSERGIKHEKTMSFLGYNSPFDLFNRRNEVIVEIEM